MNRKILIGIICFLIVACLAVGVGVSNKGGNAEKETNLISNKKTVSTVAQSSVSTEKAETNTEEKKDEENISETSSTKKEITKLSTVSSTKKETKTSRTITSSTKKENEAKPPIKSTVKSTKKTTEKSTEKKSLTVSFSVNCEKAVAYGADYPKYLIGKTKCEVKDGTTVFDLLNEECKKNGILLVHQNKSYVKSIGGLAEKDCGNGSGWIYKVNGVKPMMSASKYVLKNGDVVEWYYVTSPTD